MPAPDSTTAGRIKDANVRYHDGAAGDYDAKWGIAYDERARKQVVGKLRKALGTAALPVGRSLEVGAGTGYFSLNLLRAGLLREAVATDISDAMLATLATSAAQLGLDVQTARCEAAALPFPASSFDVLIGHAVLHHLPDLDAAFSEFRRVLRPGGTLVFCGEPSRVGDRLAALPKRAGHAIAPLWRRVVRARPSNKRQCMSTNDHAQLESAVDVHAFTPRQLEGYAGRAGFESIRVSGEELAASWFGWFNRSLESTAYPPDIPAAWRQYAYRGYVTLQALDRALLERRLPAGLFYNLLLSAHA